MKTLQLFLLLLLPNLAAAQATNLLSYYTPVALVYTNAWPDASTNATASTALAATRSDRLGWQISYVLTSSGTGTNYFDFQTSLDNTNWPAYYHTVALPANGTSTVLTNFTMDLNGMGYVRLARSRFGGGSSTTNLTLLYSPKPNLR